MSRSELTSEWTTLQNQFDSYEKYSLLVKLCNIFIFCLALFTSTLSIYVATIISVLWLQDGIWKTFQGRIEERLLYIENLMSNDVLENKTKNGAFQFNSQFSENRKQGLMLIKEYLKQALRPTVAFPHVILFLAHIALFI
jgi:hypothetical protein